MYARILGMRNDQVADYAMRKLKCPVCGARKRHYCRGAGAHRVCEGRYKLALTELSAVAVKAVEGVLTPRAKLDEAKAALTRSEPAWQDQDTATPDDPF